MHIKHYPLGQLQANCYLLIQDKECILIDPADDANFLLEEISRQNLNLIAMLATHGHFDHVMAVGEIQLSMKVPFYIHEKDLFLINRLKETAKHFLGYEPQIIDPTIIKNLPNSSLKILNFKFQIIKTPGHTPGGCCFYLPEEQALFTGDTIFKEAVGRTDLSYSSKKDLNDSINQLIKSFPEETVIYPGHGPETTIEQEAPLYHS
ncbi:MBL fold metallo-hydrolase [Candidatus Roizmanbacteria bacterium]|nr:MBL fold metallo-hydrolase [Candidatus Roizmanbacteria bacterium]